MTDLSKMRASEAYLYARCIKKAPWPEAETVIMTDPEVAYLYALNVKKTPWPEAEPVIMENPCWAYWYAREVKKTPWPEAEPIIKNSGCWEDYKSHFNIKEYTMNGLSKMTPYEAYCYALNVREAPLPEAEPIIMTDAYWSYCYALDVKKAPWPEAEPIIKNSEYWNKYKNHFNIKEKEMNNLIKATITLNDGTESIIEFSSSLEAEQWRTQLSYNSVFHCINFEKATYVKTRDIQSVVFNKSLIEMRNLAREESIQREVAYNSQPSKMVENQLATSISRF